MFYKKIQKYIYELENNHLLQLKECNADKVMVIQETENKLKVLTKELKETKDKLVNIKKVLGPDIFN